MISRTPVKPRRRLTFSLRMLMLLVLVAGVALGWKANRAHSQRRAVAAIAKVPGFVTYDYEMVNGVHKYNIEPWGPAWLRERIGDEYFQEVVEVDFYEDGLTDDQLVPVGTLDRLERLKLSGSKITDAGLAHLKNLSRLQEIDLRYIPLTDSSMTHLKPLTGLLKLDLHGGIHPDFRVQNRITDAGLAQLAGLTRLQELTIDTRGGITGAGLAALKGMTDLRKLVVLGGSAVHDADLAHLEGLTQLRDLEIGVTPITDAGLVHLKGLRQLRVLSLPATEITSAGMEHLRGLNNLERLELWSVPGIDDAALSVIETFKRLESLELAGTRITDAGLASIARLPQLKELNVNTTAVTDAGLKHLGSLRRLKTLDVRGTDVTADGIAALRAKLPALGLVATDSSGSPLGSAGLAAPVAPPPMLVPAPLTPPVVPTPP